jgi:hypothetical protein
LAKQTFDVVDVEGFHNAQIMCCLEPDTSSDEAARRQRAEKYMQAEPLRVER